MNKIRYNIIIVWIIQPVSRVDSNILRPNLNMGLTNSLHIHIEAEKLKNRCFYRLESYLCGPTWYNRLMLAHPQKCKLFTHNHNNKDDKTDTNSTRRGEESQMVGAAGKGAGDGQKKKQNDKTTKRIYIVSRDPLRRRSTHTRITNS